MLHGMQRKTVNLEDSLAEKVMLFFGSDTPERACLHELTGKKSSSESDVLQSLVELGIAAVRERQLEEGYAAWAASWDEEDEAWAKASMAEFARLYAEDDE